jgi:nucleoside-diphosphate-sugar epimerase
MQRVVVTGASGLVGAAVARRLAADGFEVAGLDAVPGQRTAIVGDLRDPSARARALRGAELLVHAAALHAPHVRVVPPAEFRAVNVDATRALLQDALSAGVQRVVYTSSTSLYGHALEPGAQAVWVDEALVPQPRDVYDETKLAAERLVAASGLNWIVLRIARCFPEPLEVMARHRLHRGVALEDVADAHLLALRSSASGLTLNVAGPYPFTADDRGALLDSADRLIAARAPAVLDAFAARGWGLPRRIGRVYDSGSAGRELGYSPQRDTLALLEHGQ